MCVFKNLKMYLMCLTVYIQFFYFSCAHIMKYETCLQGLEIIFRVGLAILQYNQTDLIQLDMEGMSQVEAAALNRLLHAFFLYRFSHNSKAACPIFPFAHELPELEI